MAQQTAIDWFINQINQYTELEINHADGSKTKTRVIPPWIMQNLIEQAKEIEKEQSMQDYDSGLFDGTMDNVNDRLYKNAEQYYNETYNKE